MFKSLIPAMLGCAVLLSAQTSGKSPDTTWIEDAGGGLSVARRGGSQVSICVGRGSSTQIYVS